MNAREKILAACAKLQKTEVEVNGEKLFLSEMTAAQSEALNDKAADDKKAGRGDYHFMARMLIACLVDEKGTPALTEADLSLVLGWGKTTLNSLATEALRLNGWKDPASKN